MLTKLVSKDTERGNGARSFTLCIVSRKRSIFSHVNVREHFSMGLVTMAMDVVYFMELQLL